VIKSDKLKWFKRNRQYVYTIGCLITAKPLSIRLRLVMTFILALRVITPKGSISITLGLILKMLNLIAMPNYTIQLGKMENGR
jgi:hypothetical protein